MHALYNKFKCSIGLFFLFCLFFIISTDIYSADTRELKDLHLVSDYARESVTKLFKRQIITRDEDGNYNPSQPITRAQMVATLMRAMGMDDIQLPTEPTFQDVPLDHWAYPYIEAAYQKGIIKGMTPNIFDTDSKCTREQMAAMLVNALELHEEAINIMISYPNSFQLTYTDAGNISEWAYTRMRFANQYNLMNGIKNDFIGPKMYATKEQMAVLVNRYLKEQPNINRMVVDASRQPLVEILDISARKIEILPDTSPQVTITYKINRPTKFTFYTYRSYDLRDCIRRIDIPYTAPGTYELVWDLKDNEGNYVDSMSYDMYFFGNELGYPLPNVAIPPIVKDRIHVSRPNTSHERLLSLLPEAKFDKTTFSPNNDTIDDIITGSITLTEEATISIYIANSLGGHLNVILPQVKYKPGTYIFSWDGREWKPFYNVDGNIAANGKYYLNIYVTDKNGQLYQINKYKNAYVTLTDSNDVTASEPLQRIRVKKNGVYGEGRPGGPSYLAQKDETFPIITFNATTYDVVLSKDIVGRFHIADVELMDLDKLPEKWATSINDISEFYDDIRSPAKTLWSNQPSKILYKGTRGIISHSIRVWRTRICLSKKRF